VNVSDSEFSSLKKQRSNNKKKEKNEPEGFNEVIIISFNCGKRTKSWEPKTFGIVSNTNFAPL
jgi:hypothetical protein